MKEEEFKKLCPNLYNAVSALIATRWIYNNSIRIYYNSKQPEEMYMRCLENEKYLLVFYYKPFKEQVNINLN